jgi:hypothetical protein
MPPQQPDRPLDVLDDFFSFGAHGFFLDRPHLAIAAEKRNIARRTAATLDFARIPKRNQGDE